MIFFKKKKNLFHLGDLDLFFLSILSNQVVSPRSFWPTTVFCFFKRVEHVECSFICRTHSLVLSEQTEERVLTLLPWRALQAIKSRTQIYRGNTWKDKSEGNDCVSNTKLHGLNPKLPPWTAWKINGRGKSIEKKLR